MIRHELAQDHECCPPFGNLSLSIAADKFLGRKWPVGTFCVFRRLLGPDGKHLLDGTIHSHSFRSDFARRQPQLAVWLAHLSSQALYPSAPAGARLASAARITRDDARGRKPSSSLMGSFLAVFDTRLIAHFVEIKRNTPVPREPRQSR